MDFTLVWTEPALDDLEAAIRYVATRSESAAQELRADLLGSVATLRRFPFLGPAYERDPSGRCREIICRGYRVFTGWTSRRRRWRS